MYQLSNEQLSVSISPMGAELQSIVHNTTRLEYMWSGDARFWGKKSPVLFPIVGGLKNGNYTFDGISYTMGRHGFARERFFEVTEQTNSSITFSLSSDEASIKIYPFHFRFSIQYTLEENSVRVLYRVENIGNKPMYFSVGAHPAFSVPLVEGDSFEDYYLEFNQQETTGIWPLSPEGLIKESPTPFFSNNNRIPLSKSLFYGDALVFKGLQSDCISIRSDKHSHGLSLSYTNFPFMGIWSAKDANFVCIEPWCGIADSILATGNLQEKEGIHFLEEHEIFERSWSVTVF